MYTHLCEVRNYQDTTLWVCIDWRSETDSLCVYYWTSGASPPSHSVGTIINIYEVHMYVIVSMRMFDSAHFKKMFEAL